jgi:predicted RNase H-like HicB family nuclease
MPDNQALQAPFEMANLFPKHTGLPFVVWISVKGGARHDVRFTGSPLSFAKQWRRQSMNTNSPEDLNYPVRIEYDEEDGLFIADFLDLPGCSATGSTVTEAYERAQEAKAEWLRLTAEQGLPIPKPSRTQDKVSANSKAMPDEMTTVGIRPEVRVIEGEMDADSFERLKAWIELNRATLISYWEGDIDTQDALDALAKVE